MRIDRSRSLMVVAAVVVFAACGGSSESADEPTDESTNEPNGDESTDATESEQGTEEVQESDGPPRAVESARGSLSNPVEATLASGGVMVAGIECGLDGANLLIVGAEGLVAGEEHDAVIEPSGGQARFFVQENGDGYTGYQASFTEASYTLTWPNIDDGLTLTVDGCPG